MDLKSLFTALAIIISISNVIYYLYTVYFGKTKPHAYTWLIWTIVLIVVWLAQVSDGAGVGAWVTLMGILACLLRAIAGFTHGVKNITKSDKLCLFSCFVAIVFWILTKNPLTAIIILTLIDLIGFLPTFRHAWSNPYDENIFSFFLFGITFLLSFLALENISFTTALYPIALASSSWIFILYVWWRRSKVIS